jgi:F0F1-type ATP synthase assembly protein I
LHTKKLLVRLLTPEAAVTAFSFLLPDLIDKPLWVLGVFSDGRNIGHTLLLVFLVAFAFSLKKRAYGLFAVCGGISHLLLDTSGFMPWFYPFKRYDFPNVDYHGIVTWYNVAETLLEMAFVVIVVSMVVFLILSFSSWVRGRRNPRVRGTGKSARSADMEQQALQHRWPWTIL